MAKLQKRTDRRLLPKTPTGITGFDEVTGGGLPTGRPTLVCGSAGCGKTLFATEFLIRGAIDYGESGVFVSFEETARDLSANVRSLGFDLDDLIRRKKLFIDHIHVERSDVEESGDYDLEGLFIRLQHAVTKVGAKRIVLDTVESIFSSFSNTAVLRSELRRLFTWLKDKGLTAVITGEKGEATLTRQGLEEYVSDCVIFLDHRVVNQISTRSLRIVKYRGSIHGTNEYPFLIDQDGFSVLPLSSLGLEHEISTERLSTGIQALDEMLGQKGYYRGSSILLSGTAGIGKSSFASKMADASCRRGERCLYFSYEESMSQVVRNIRSIGLDLTTWINKGLLKFHAARPSLHGLEMHLVSMHRMIEEFKPRLVIVDPITSLVAAGTERDANSMMIRLIDYLKGKRITGLFTSLTSAGETLETSSASISSLADTWILLRDIESNGERNRGIYILKSRGMPHSNQIREFVLNRHGIDMIDVCVGPEGVLTGSARKAREAEEKAAIEQVRAEVENKSADLRQKRKALDSQIAALRLQYKNEEAEVRRLLLQEEKFRARQSSRNKTLRGFRQVPKGKPNEVERN
jgi:circadian clock protein KaiC